MSSKATTRLLVFLHLSAALTGAVAVAPAQTAAHTHAVTVKRSTLEAEAPTQPPHDAAGAQQPSHGDVLVLLDRPDTDKMITKRDDSAAASPGMWFGPRMGRAANDGNSVQGMWFGPRMGRSSSQGMWFGPRMGRSSEGTTHSREATAGMWFGPRMGRSVEEATEVDDEDGSSGSEVLLVLQRQPEGRARVVEAREDPAAGMWFGPRMGRAAGRGQQPADDALAVVKKSADGSSSQAAAAGGMWFGPRMGRRSDAEADGPKRGRGSAPEGMWFGPRMGRRSEAEADGSKRGRGSAPEGMWFGPRLG